MKEHGLSAAGMARQLLQQRHERNGALGGDLFGDPAWELLLHLFAASEEGEPLLVADLCSHSSVSPASGLRWIKALESEGKIVLVPNLGSPDRPFVKLAPAAYEQMRRLLEGWAGKAAPLRRGA